MDNYNEIKLSQLNFRSQKQNYQKCPPGSIVNKQLEAMQELESGDLSQTYDIDAIMGLITVYELEETIKDNIILNFSKTKPKVKQLSYEFQDQTFLISECSTFNFGHLELTNGYKIEIFLLKINGILNKYDMIKILNFYDKDKKILNYDKERKKFTGKIERINFFKFRESITNYDENIFIYFETFGCKKIFNVNNIPVLLMNVNRIINTKKKTVLLDFCIVYEDRTRNILFPKIITLEEMGERPNYYSFFSYKYPSVHRYRSKYVSCSKFLKVIDVSKVNFYSSLQDCFGEYTIFKYYPLISKELVEEIFEGDYDYKKYNKKMNNLKNIRDKINEVLNSDRRLSYRFEFRMHETEINKLMSHIEIIIRTESFIYENKIMFKLYALRNLETLIQVYESLPLSLIYVGQHVILETMIISGFLRGDIFHMPFTTVRLRTLTKDLWIYGHSLLSEKKIKNIISHDDQYVILESFCSTLKNISKHDLDIIKYLIELKEIFYCKILLYEEIERMIFFNQCVLNKKERLFSINSSDFFQYEFLPALEPNDPLRLLVESYVDKFGTDIYYKILEKKEYFYFEKKDVLIKFNNKLEFNFFIGYKIKNILEFLQIIPKIPLHWTEEELIELCYAKYIYNHNRNELTLKEIYDNILFSFNIKRNFKSFKDKFYKVEENNYFKFYTIKSRIEYLENILQRKLSRQFKKEYIYLIYQCLLKIKLLK